MRNQKKIDIKGKAELGLLDKDRFYRLLQENSNYMERETVEMVYMGLVKLIGKELRANKFVRLPFIADFNLMEAEGGYRFAGRTKQNKHIVVPNPGFFSLRIYPHRRIRDYFAKLNKETRER